MLIKRLFASELLRGSFGYLLASIATSAVPFILLPVLTRYLTPAEYGEVAMFSVWMSLLAAFCGLSVHGAATRKYFDRSDDPRELSTFIFMCLLVLLSSTLFTVIVVWFASEFLSELVAIPESWLLLGCLCAAASFIIQLYLGQLQARKKVKLYGLMQISQASINLVVSVLFVTILLWGALGRVLGIVIPTLAFGLIALLCLRRASLITPRWDFSKGMDAVRFGIPLIPHILGMFLLNTVDRAVINSELGLDKAGIYMVAVQVSMGVNIILEAVNRTFVPWLYERLQKNEGVVKSYAVRVTYGYYAVLALGVLISFLVAEKVLLIITGPEYAEAGSLVAWLILGKAFHGGYLMVTNYLFYTRHTGVLSLITVTCGILNVVLMLSFIQWWGLLGVAWAYVISKIIQWLVTWYFANRKSPMPWFGTSDKTF